MEKKKSHTGLIVVLIILVVLLVGAVIFLLNYKISFKSKKTIEPEQVVEEVKDAVVGEEGEFSMITETTIQDVLDISELSTMEYTYNSVCTVPIDETEDKEGNKRNFYVKYNGTITAGVDFSKIEVSVDEDTKAIVIKIPNAEIMDTVVDTGTSEFIYDKEKDEKEDHIALAQEKCTEDLKEKANKEDEILAEAQENAKSIIEALIEPWVEQIDPEYTVIYE